MLFRKTNLFSCSILSLVFFTTSIFAITKDQAKTIAITTAFGNKIGSSNVMVTKNLVPANAEIRCLKTSYASPANPSWMFFSDDNPGANWSHAARVAFVDAVTGDCQLISVQWPPVAGSDNFSLDYDIVAKNVVIAPDPKGLYTTPLSSQIARNSSMKSGLTATYSSSKYAVLICGGYDAGNLHERYYSDIQEMYTTLRNTYGYPAANIYVLCADGDADGNGMISFDGVEYSMDLDGNGTIDCNTAASKANITSTFSTLNTKMTSSDFLFVFTTDHGSNIASPPASIYDEGSLTLWDYDEMRDDEFAVAVNQIANYGYEVFCFEQCFSGDMINDLWGKNRVIASAANWDEYSWGRVFSSLWINAVNGSAPAADVNNDLVVSMREAFDYAELNDLADEDPQYYESYPGLGATLSLNGLIPPEPPPTLPQVKIQINTGASAPVTNCPRVQFKLLNVDPSKTVDLTKIEIRYWFASQTTQTHASMVDYANYQDPYTVITSKVTSQIVPQILAPQTHYMSVKFSSGVPLLPPGAANNVIVQSRFNKADWSNFDQRDDWSYIQTTNFVDAKKVAVFYNGTLVWGSEPSDIPPPPPSSSFKVQSSTSNTGAVSNQLYINVRIHNTGTVSEAISSLDLKYWYSKEGTNPEVVSIDWVAKLPAGTTINSQAQAALEPVTIAGQTGVVHLSFPSASINIEPNSYIEARLRVNKSDWSNYTQTNDYSFIPQSSFTDCNKVCLYKNNVLVWGIQP
jgi:hypothetical protein